MEAIIDVPEYCKGCEGGNKRGCQFANPVSRELAAVATRNSLEREGRDEAEIAEIIIRHENVMNTCASDCAAMTSAYYRKKRNRKLKARRAIKAAAVNWPA